MRIIVKRIVTTLEELTGEEIQQIKLAVRLLKEKE